GAEAALQLVVEAEVDVDLLIARTVERTGRRLAEPAGRLHLVAEENELGVLVAVAENLPPRVLRVVQDEGDELDPAILLRRRLDRALVGRRSRVHVRDEGEEIAAGDEAQQPEQEKAPDTDRDACAHAHPPAILDVVARASRRPAHGIPPRAIPRCRFLPRSPAGRYRAFWCQSPPSSVPWPELASSFHMSTGTSLRCVAPAVLRPTAT